MQTTISTSVTTFGCHVTDGQCTQRFTEVVQAVEYTAAGSRPRRGFRTPRGAAKSTHRSR